jgi:DNA-binding response OmpR family regulator
MATPERRAILIVQDWPITGAGLSAEFEALGFLPAGPFRKPGPALEWMAVHEPLLAVLALKFQDGPSVMVARELRRHGLPFVFLSGSASLRPLIEGDFPGVPWIEAPAPARRLLASLSPRQAMRRRAA